MREVGTDDKGRKIIVEGKDTLHLVLPTGQSVTFSRRHLARIVAEHRAEADKFQKYLDALDAEQPAQEGGGE